MQAIYNSFCSLAWQLNISSEQKFHAEALHSASIQVYFCADCVGCASSLKPHAWHMFFFFPLLLFSGTGISICPHDKVALSWNIHKEVCLSLNKDLHFPSEKFALALKCFFATAFEITFPKLLNLEVCFSNFNVWSPWIKLSSSNVHNCILFACSCSCYGLRGNDQ